MPKMVGRFAPSPSGRIHAGNIFACLIAWLDARSHGGSFVLRIEDLDRERSKREYADQILRDLEWLGFDWDGDVAYQSNRDDTYTQAFEQLRDKGVVYPCFCTRADLNAASAPHRSGYGIVYPGTCRNLTPEQVALKSESRAPAWRVRVDDRVMTIDDAIQGSHTYNLAHDCGDFIVRRSDGMFAYQLAVVVDDAASGVTSVVRGCDLLDSTPRQNYLYELLDLPIPTTVHIPLFVAQDGRRLAKRDHDAHVDEMVRVLGSPEAIIGHIAYLAGIIDNDEPCVPADLLNKDFMTPLTGKISITWTLPS